MATTNREPLVARIIAAQAWRLSPPGLPAPGDPHGDEPAERELLKSLGSKQPFRVRGDLSEWIIARAVTAVRAGRRQDDPALVAEIAAQLETPKSPFNFALEFANDSTESYRLAFTADLSLTVEADYDESTGTGSVSMEPARLEGKALAYSYAAALDESCRIIREAVGALLAVGLATTSRLPWFHELEEIRLEAELPVDDFDLPPPPGELRDLGSRVCFGTYTGSPFDEARARRTAGHPADRFRDQIARLWQGDAGRSQEIRTACGLYARAQVASDPGVAIVNYAMCLEGLLLQRSDKDNTTARLSEAIAYRLGRSAEDRDRLRKTTRKLYDLRSHYVHTGSVQPDLELGEEWARIAGDALRREIEDF